MRARRALLAPVRHLLDGGLRLEVEREPAEPDGPVHDGGPGPPDSLRPHEADDQGLRQGGRVLVGHYIVSVTKQYLKLLLSIAGHR